MMRDREAVAAQLTHRVAAEIHRALADSGMTIADLSEKIGESPRFLKRVLQGENGLPNSIKLRLLSDVAWATGQWLSIAISPDIAEKSFGSVETGDQTEGE